MGDFGCVNELPLSDSDGRRRFSATPLAVVFANFAELLSRGYSLVCRVADVACAGNGSWSIESSSSSVCE